jgi:hypothetical protein
MFVTDTYDYVEYIIFSNYIINVDVYVFVSCLKFVLHISKLREWLLHMSFVSTKNLKCINKSTIIWSRNEGWYILLEDSNVDSNFSALIYRKFNIYPSFLKFRWRAMQLLKSCPRDIFKKWVERDRIDFSHKRCYSSINLVRGQEFVSGRKRLCHISLNKAAKVNGVEFGWYKSRFRSLNTTHHHK